MIAHEPGDGLGVGDKRMGWEESQSVRVKHLGFAVIGSYGGTVSMMALARTLSLLPTTAL